MAKEKLSKTETKKTIENFFEDISDKTPKDVKKIKRLAMKHNIPLREKRKSFCKNCLVPYSGREKVRIRDGKKVVKCENCGYVARWRVK